jgi:hypothetical protein
MRRIGVTRMSENLRGSHSQWGKGRTSSEPGDKPGHASKRLGDSIMTLKIDPKVAMPKAPKLFAMGSCFAREIERGFKLRGFDVLSLPEAMTQDPELQSDGFFNAALLNRYNVPSMELEFRNLLEGPGVLGDDELVIDDSPHGLHDMHYYGFLPKETTAEIGSRRTLLRKYLAGLTEADIVIVTLGLAEACFDLMAQKYRNGSPSIREIRQKRPLEMHFVDYDETLACLERIRGLLAKHCVSKPTLIVTVSPVPLTATYFSDDVVIANSEAKAILRAAAGTFSARHADAVYFPSYEIVTLSDRKTAYKGDMRHVNRGIVDHIVETFVQTFDLDATMREAQAEVA